MRRFATTVLNNLLSKKKPKPVILRGARQVGKSTLVRMFAQNQGLELDEINLEQQVMLDSVFESLDMTAIEKALSACVRRPVGRPGSLLFLDEIQATPHALSALRYFYEQRPDTRVVAAGSLLEFALADATFSMPVGRVDFLHIEPMTFDEFLLSHNEDYLVEQIRSYTLGSPWPENLHAQLNRRFREYLMVGGMPEAVEAFVAEPTGDAWSRVHESILRTYRDDFMKYGKRSQILLLHEIFARVSGYIGRKIKYSELAPNERSATTRQVLQLFDFARLIRRAIHTDAQGLPIGASADPNHAKLYMVDVGLAGRGMGVLPRSSLFDESSICEGPLAEQFVAQHLATFAGMDRQGELHYWRREARQSQAEVDFLVQYDRWIIPIEVKSGETGSLRSLHQFMISHPKTPLAVKLCGQIPRWSESDATVLTADGTKTYRLRLLTLPLYMVGQLGRILGHQLERVLPE